MNIVHMFVEFMMEVNNMSQYNILQELISEEIATEMKPRPLYPAHIFERSYVEGVLGIRLPK